MKLDITILHEKDRLTLLKAIDDAPVGSRVTLEDRPMTDKQKGSMYVWFDLMAHELNDAGMDMKKILCHHIDIPWSAASFKEHVWKPTLEGQFIKKSTEKQTTIETQDVFQTLDRFFASEYGFPCPPWPTRR